MAVLLERDPRKRRFAFRPQRDLCVMGVCLPLLGLTGFLCALAASVTGFTGEKIPPPSGLFSWMSAAAASLSTAYLEESYFRVYLPEKLRDSAAEPPVCFLAPALIFALCHVWEGPWGFVNALLAGVFLSLAYNKTSSFHGIALAHGLYNIAVFVTAAVLP